MSVVRAKFFCSKATPAELGGASQVQLGAVCRGVENAIWSQATPAGSIQMYVLNTPAFEQFEEGAEYEVTFTKVAKPVQGDGHDPKPVTNKFGWVLCETCGHNLGDSKGDTSDEALGRHREFWGAQSDEPVA